MERADTEAARPQKVGRRSLADAELEEEKAAEKKTNLEAETIELSAALYRRKKLKDCAVLHLCLQILEGGIHQWRPRE